MLLPTHTPIHPPKHTHTHTPTQTHIHTHSFSPSSNYCKSLKTLSHYVLRPFLIFSFNLDSLQLPFCISPSLPHVPLFLWYTKLVSLCVFVFLYAGPNISVFLYLFSLYVHPCVCLSQRIYLCLLSLCWSLYLVICLTLSFFLSFSVHCKLKSHF